MPKTCLTSRIRFCTDLLFCKIPLISYCVTAVFTSVTFRVVFHIMFNLLMFTKIGHGCIYLNFVVFFLIAGSTNRKSSSKSSTSIRRKFVNFCLWNVAKSGSRLRYALYLFLFQIISYPDSTSSADSKWHSAAKPWPEASSWQFIFTVSHFYGPPY